MKLEVHSLNLTIKIASPLNYTLSDIATTCTYIAIPHNTIKVKTTKIAQGPYMISSLINTALTIHCALERTHEFEKIEIGNTELHVKDDCMVEETSIDPHFKILPSTSALKNSTYTIEHEEPKILQILANLDNISLTNNIKHLQMNKEISD